MMFKDRVLIIYQGTVLSNFKNNLQGTFQSELFLVYYFLYLGDGIFFLNNYNIWTQDKVLTTDCAKWGMFSSEYI